MPTHQNIVSFTAVIQNGMKLFKTVHSKYHKTGSKLKYYSFISRCLAWELKSKQPTHPPGHEVCRQTLGEADDGGLGGAVGEPAGGALDVGGDRGHVNDGAAVVEEGAEGLAHPEHAADVDVETPLENFIRAIKDGSLVNIAGAVEQDVDVVTNFVCQRFYIILVGHVNLHPSYVTSLTISY